MVYYLDLTVQFQIGYLNRIYEKDFAGRVGFGPKFAIKVQQF